MNKTVLVVDDNAYIRKNMRDILEEYDFKVYEAATGMEGIDSYLEVKPDLVIMDINMPSLNGLMATKKIVEINPEADIIICSSMLFIPYYQKLALEAGAKALISKPFTKLEFIKGINDLLELD